MIQVQSRRIDTVVNTFPSGSGCGGTSPFRRLQKTSYASGGIPFKSDQNAQMARSKILILLYASPCRYSRLQNPVSTNARRPRIFGPSEGRNPFSKRGIWVV